MARLPRLPYHVLPAPGQVAAEIRSAIRAFSVKTVMFPLAIANEDHKLTRLACDMLIVNEFELVDHWVAWTDIPYRATRHPAAPSGRDGIDLEPWAPAAVDGRKGDAVLEYASQRKGLYEAFGQVVVDEDLGQPEQIYSIVRAR